MRKLDKFAVSAPIGRQRKQDGEIGQKFGRTSIRTLRKIYGANFAVECAETELLGEVLKKLDADSIKKLVHHYESGRLEKLLHEVT